MLEEFSKRLFEVLQAEASTSLGRDHPCSLALCKALETGMQTDIHQAQQQLSALPEDVQELLMKATHNVLREDPAALLKIWRGGPTDRLN